MVRTWTTSSSRPTLNAWSCTDLSIGCQHREERPRDVLDVDQRAPRRAVALQAHLAAGEGSAGEVVDDDVSAQARARAVRRGVAQVGRAEVLVGELADALLGHHLALAVRRHRVELAVLGDGAVAGCAVEAARGREDVPRDAGVPGDLRQVGCAVGVDRVGRVRVEVAERVVGDGGQVHDGVEASRSSGRWSRMSPVRDSYPPGCGPKSQPSYQPASRPTTSWPAAEQHGHQHGTDVAAVSGDENAHRRTFLQLV